MNVYMSLPARSAIGLMILLILTIPAVAEHSVSLAPAQGYSLDSRGYDGEDSLDGGLIGFWEHRSDYGSVTLEVMSENTLVVSGEKMRYRLAPGILRIQTQEGEFEYPYQLAGGRLVITMPTAGGRSREVAFRRVNLSQGPAVLQPHLLEFGTAEE